MWIHVWPQTITSFLNKISKYSTNTALLFLFPLPSILSFTPIYLLSQRTQICSSIIHGTYKVWELYFSHWLSGSDLQGPCQSTRQGRTVDEDDLWYQRADRALIVCRVQLLIYYVHCHLNSTANAVIKKVKINISQRWGYWVNGRESIQEKTGAWTAFYASYRAVLCHPLSCLISEIFNCVCEIPDATVLNSCPYH